MHSARPARAHALATRRRLRVEGIVQGVGFRPFVFRLARKLGLCGFVGNDAHGVFIEVEGETAAVDEFAQCLRSEAPALAAIRGIESNTIACVGDRTFRILESEPATEHDALVSPEVATCAECRRELFDPNDRRYRYPFTNCTNCGPRFTIVMDVPYDRPNTTMAGFAMCAACRREYNDPADRRFHAEPVCCPECGPQPRLTDAGGAPVAGDAIDTTARLLRAGSVVAVKGLGGYHIAALAASEDAVGKLRARKHREDKPFAVMARDLDAARRMGEIGAEEARLLTSPQAPIVLVAHRTGAAVASSVAPQNRSLGIMLAYTPLHHLLLDAVDEPIVLTSGNVSDEPIAFEDTDILARLAPVVDYFLSHDRPVHMRVDDSVVRVVGPSHAPATLPLRRARGYVPRPVELPFAARRPVLACGAELKNTFTLAKGRHAFVSQHIGDLENYETFLSYVDGIEHMKHVFDVTPDVVAYDLHPEYLSTKYALDLDGVDVVGVQHHHAHIAACLADNEREAPVIGVAFDGLGFGLDTTMWGGEVLVADLAGFDRAATFAPVPMPGGAAAIREPWRMAAAYLDAAYDGGAPPTAVAGRHGSDWDDVRAVAAAGVNSPPTSGVGRLFDAVAAIIGVRDAINYEGQAAIELEQRVDRTERGDYPVAIEAADPMRCAGSDIVRAVVSDLADGVPAPAIAARVHNTLARVVEECCLGARDSSGLSTVAISGGVFQNVVLLEQCATRLRAAGFEVLVHRQVPPNDAGISLGQVAVASARDRRDV